MKTLPIAIILFLLFGCNQNQVSESEILNKTFRKVNEYYYQTDSIGIVKKETLLKGKENELSLIFFDQKAFNMHIETPKKDIDTTVIFYEAADNSPMI